MEAPAHRHGLRLEQRRLSLRKFIAPIIAHAALLPAEVAENPILFPAQDLMSGLEFGAASTLTNPDRAELLARFKAA